MLKTELKRLRGRILREVDEQGALEMEARRKHELLEELAAERDAIEVAIKKLEDANEG